MLLISMSERAVCPEPYVYKMEERQYDYIRIYDG